MEKLLNQKNYPLISREPDSHAFLPEKKQLAMVQSVSHVVAAVCNIPASNEKNLTRNMEY